MYGVPYQLTEVDISDYKYTSQSGVFLMQQVVVCQMDTICINWKTWQKTTKLSDEPCLYLAKFVR